MKQWKILDKKTFTAKSFKNDDVIKLLLKNRNITNTTDQKEFLNPKLEDITPKSVGLDLDQLKKALKRIEKAIKDKEKIVVFGDYDVDGITGTAILWETLHALGANVLPFIPNRVEEGYGLSLKALQNQELTRLQPKLIITVDNGIVANDAVEFANGQAIDVIITDHHAKDKTLPAAYAIVHTTQLCGAGVAWVLSKEISKTLPNPPLTGREQSISNLTKKIQSNSPPDKGDQGGLDTHLELAALGTICDLVPLVGANRAIVMHGLKKLTQTKRPGLLALYKNAGLEKEAFQVYDVGYIIGPRLNAAGRIESAMDSLRLVCTTDKLRAKMLADQLELTNRERQLMLKQSAEHAVAGIRNQESGVKKILIVVHEDYNEGVIGLIAGKLVQEFYRPSIVIALREKHSKASVRSIEGFNIIAFLRSHAEHFVNLGGHPMAAGFTVETEKIVTMQLLLENGAEELLEKELLIPSLKIDCNLPLEFVTTELYEEMKQLAPFGMNNPEPLFADEKVTVEDIRFLGKEKTHVRLQLQKGSATLEAIGFGMAEQAKELHIGDKINVAYTIDENTWNGQTKLQLKLRDIHRHID